MHCNAMSEAGLDSRNLDAVVRGCRDGLLEEQEATAERERAMSPKHGINI